LTATLPGLVPVTVTWHVPPDERVQVPEKETFPFPDSEKAMGSHPTEPTKPVRVAVQDQVFVPVDVQDKERLVLAFVTVSLGPAVPLLTVL
jgi:hypothetical protein